MSGHEGLIADKVSLAEGASVGAGSRIEAQEIELGPGAKIAPGVRITCDRLRLGLGAKIGEDADILCPEIDLAEGCSIGRDFSAELNHHLILGEHSSIGHRVAAVAQGFKAGRFLWLKNDVLIGGGGARGPDSYLEIGDRTSVFDKCFINLSERVTIGSGSALSYNVVLLTHGAWQSPLKGYKTKFGPIDIGDDVVVYLNSSVMPGVSIGDGSVIGAGSVVLADIPANCLAAGNPAEIRRGPGTFPETPTDEQRKDIVRDILEDYLKTLASKGGKVVEGDLASGNSVRLRFAEVEFTLVYVAGPGEAVPPGLGDGAVLISFGGIGDLPEGVYHLDLGSSRVDLGSSRVDLGSSRVDLGSSQADLGSSRSEGTPNALGEDLRDYLRRRGIRIFCDLPFRTLPLENLERLKRKRAEKA